MVIFGKILWFLGDCVMLSLMCAWVGIVVMFLFLNRM